jgi:predicted helicase
LAARKHLTVDTNRLVTALYRPFTRKWLYFAWELNEDWYQLNQLFSPGSSSRAIVFTDTSPRAPFSVLACDGPFEHHLAASSDSFQCVGLFRFGKDGEAVENVTDWALDQFRKKFRTGKGKKDRGISKEAIFHYVYGVLHDPIYREKYALNLKREFPRIPFYKDFWQWAEWGKELMDLHIGYESVTPAKLTRIDLPDEKSRKAGLPPKCILKVDKDGGRIIVDGETTLTGIPPEAWGYRLGNRSRLNGSSTSTKKRHPKTRPSARSSRPTALRTTKKKSSTC